MENAPWPITSWEEGMMSTMLLPLGSIKNSGLLRYLISLLVVQLSLFFQWFQFVFFTLVIFFLSRWMAWGNFVGCSWVFSNRADKSFSLPQQSSILLGQNIKSLIVRWSKFSQLVLSQDGLWLWTSSGIKEGGLSCDVEVLTVNGQRDEMNLLKIGPRIDWTCCHATFSLDSLLFCSQPFFLLHGNRNAFSLFVCLFERWSPVEVNPLNGEAGPQPLQFESIWIWNAVWVKKKHSIQHKLPLIICGHL